MKPAAVKAESERALSRDDFTCRACGFRARQYQRAVQVGDEFVTMCLFCEQCLSLETAAMTGSGALIWLPEMSQADLNHLARAIYVARASGGEMAKTATRALDSLMARRAEVKKRLGSDDPLLLATVFQEALSPKEYEAREGKISGIRLMPLEKRMARTRQGDVDHFPKIVAYWRSPEGPFGKVPAEKWDEMFKSAAAPANGAVPAADASNGAVKK